MGYALAAEAARRGREVCLVSGPVSLPCPEGVERIQVQSARDMLTAAEEALSGRSCAVLLGVAAVSDVRPRECVEGKPAKEEMSDHIELVPNPDVLATLVGRAGARLAVGFALESVAEDRGGLSGALERARGKLERKGLDAIVLNQLASMENPETECWWVEPRGEPLPLGRGDKTMLAVSIVDRIQLLLRH